MTRPGQDRIYLAGPMSGIADFNYPAFNHAAEQLRAKGFVVENPAENTPPICNSWPGYMRIALRQMLTCDMVVFLPGWRQSKGAQLERQVANRLSIPVFEIAEVL
ncbi:MAG: DUF4406 domain-containing protein [Methylomonas sp.]|jgi:nucleoside 2-deoxyribosyltransferase|uniref:DUF4406 domain-containing protein n=1 Tax=Methylomonas sp. TaxID=418 RepID=UPI0025D3B9F7|nr:DUF4406 domain-containing protein [Methylomonas sp.]MCK9606229.1 DUF4406 domain-containing protein [Methylomonas sp.]